MVRVVVYNLGWRLSKKSKLKLVNGHELSKELYARSINCEVPGCKEIAFDVLRSGVTALVCNNHLLAHNSSPGTARAVEAAVKHSWQGHMTVITNAAYLDGDNFIATTYTSSSESLLDVAANAITNPSFAMQDAAQKFATKIPKLDTENTEQELFDIFMV